MKVRLTQKAITSRKVKLSQTETVSLEAPTASGRQEIVWDTELKGFGLLLSGKTNARSFIAQRDLPNGRARRVTIGSVAEMSLEEARAEAADAIHALRQGKDPKARGAAAITVAAAIELYVERKGTKLRPRTAELYNDCARRYFAKWATLPLRDITPRMVEEEHARIGKEFGEGAANNAMRTLRAAYNHIARDADLPPDLVRLREHWFTLPRRQRRVKGDDLAAFYRAVDALPNPVQRDFLKLALFTGLRRREAAGLLWSDVDFSDGIIRLPGHRTKSGRLFDVPMTDLVRDLLVARRAIGDTKWVFPADSKSGHLEEPKAPLALVEQACGIKVSTHDLRRSYLTVAERHVHGVALKALANHALSDADVTEGYVGIEPKEIAEAAQVVADKLRELCQIPRPSGENVTRMAK
jgi:integrase